MQVDSGTKSHVVMVVLAVVAGVLLGLELVRHADRMGAKQFILYAMVLGVLVVAVAFASRSQ